MEKLAFIIPDLRGGGAERALYNLLKELSRRQVPMEIDLVMVKAGGVFMKEVPASVRIVDLGQKRTLFAVIPLVRYLRKNRPCALVAHLSHINLLSAIAIRLAGTHTPLVAVEHGTLVRESFPDKEWWVHWGLKKVYPSTAAIVAVAKDTAANIASRLGLPASKVTTIYNPIATAELTRQAAFPAPHPWLMNREMPVILAAGRLVKGKDIKTLLAAFAELRTNRQARLIILGEGEERAELERTILRLGIGEEVDMPGFSENPFAYMAASDVFVLSSLNEALPSVLIEAMACGCPVISTDCPGGVREILQDGKFGVLVPVGDVQLLANAMAGSLDSAADRDRLRRRAAFFSPERAADAYLALMATIKKDVQKKIVLHLITGLRTGGAERMLCRLLSAIDRQRWKPVVVSLTDGGEPEAWLREQGITVYNLRMRPGRLPSPAKWLQLIRLARRIRPALIQGWMYHANLAAQFVRPFLRRRPPVVWSIHHSINALSAEKAATAGMIRLGARISRMPDAIVYASGVSRAQHVALGYSDRKGCLIPYGIDSELFLPSGGEQGGKRGGESGAIRATLGLHPAGLVIGSLARYHPMKDHRNFLRAAALLCGRPGSEGVHFLLAGAGIDDGNEELRGWIREEGIEDRVHLLGERPDVARVLSAMDIFTVSSSHGEALPLVLLEAMSCGVTCVTTDVGDAGIAVGDTGRVVAPRDPEALAGAWLALIDAGEEGRRALGKAAREKIINNYGLKICAESYDKLYQSLTR